jgi:2-polyprenyl-3-methyl-5-hydroxy-6-metoxy-1,4-benzoquinol methylase
MTMDDTQTFWESFYGDKHRVWSGRPNDVLVRHATGVTPGRVLDLGCGEGADAIWLAQQGWRVTAVDISQTALERAATHARAAGVEDRIEWIRDDLAASLPAGPFDLVSALYLHSPVTLDREEILRRSAQTVAPQGRLVVVGHASMPHSTHDADSQVHYPTPEELIDALALPDDWRVEVLESNPRSVTGPDGRQAEIVDAVVMFRRVQ